jgi:hypothetical protein
LDVSIMIAPLHFGNIISCHDSDPWLEGNFVSPLSYQHWDNATWVSSASSGLLPRPLFFIISNLPLSLSTLIWNSASAFPMHTTQPNVTFSLSPWSAKSSLWIFSMTSYGAESESE